MNKLKNIVSSSIVFIISLFFIFQPIVSADYSIKETIEETVDFILNKGVESDWEAIGIARSGREIPDSYFDILTKNIEEQVINGLDTERIKITDVERLAMATVAVGLDSTNIENLNLIELIYDSPERHADNELVDTMTFQGNNGLIFALIALDSLNFEVPEGSNWDRQQLIAALLSNQNDDGSWPLNPMIGGSDIDITGMALTGLSPYHNQTEVREALDHAVKWLSSVQTEHGGFDGGDFVGGITSEATAQVIIGLTSYGIDPTDEQFTKNGITLIDHFLEYQNDDGGFKHTMDDDYSDAMATEQALQALVAYDLFLEGKGNLYHFSDNTSDAVNGTAISEDVKDENALNSSESAIGIYHFLLIGAVLLIIIGGVLFYLKRRSQK